MSTYSGEARGLCIQPLRQQEEEEREEKEER